MSEGFFDREGEVACEEADKRGKTFKRWIGESYLGIAFGDFTNDTDDGTGKGYIGKVFQSTGILLLSCFEKLCGYFFGD